LKNLLVEYSIERKFFWPPQKWPAKEKAWRILKETIAYMLQKYAMVK